MCNTCVTNCNTCVTNAGYPPDWGMYRTQEIGDANSINRCYTTHISKMCYSDTCVTHLNTPQQEKYMEKKKKTRNFAKKSVPCRISKYALSELTKIGNGNWKEGLFKAIEAHDALNRTPEIKLMHDVDLLMTDLVSYYGNNHYEHFSNFPACFRQFLKQGHLNWSKINKRYERKHIDEFQEDKEEDVK